MPQTGSPEQTPNFAPIDHRGVAGCDLKCKEKHLTNMRSQGEGKGIQLEAPLRMTLERAIEYIDMMSTWKPRQSHFACGNALWTRPHGNEQPRSAR